MIKPLIMIIEDDLSSGAVIQKKINEYGYESLQVRTAKEAKKLLLDKEVKPVLVLCNTNLPDTTGVQFLRETLIRNLNLNICMVTNRVERVELLEALQLGVADFINRPIQSSFYSEKLRRLVELGAKKAAVKNALAQQSDPAKVEQAVSALRIQNSVKKPA